MKAIQACTQPPTAGGEQILEDSRVASHFLHNVWGGIICLGGCCQLTITTILPSSALHMQKGIYGFSCEWQIMTEFGLLLSLLKQNVSIELYLELNNLSHILEFWKHVFIELQELLVDFFFTVLQTRICVIVVSSTLFHPKSNEHTPDKECLAAVWIVMSPRAS